MAKRKKEYVFEEKKADEPPKQPPAPVQGPILNGYTDKIIDHAAFLKFVGDQYKISQHDYSVEQFLANTLSLSHAYFSPWSNTDAVKCGQFIAKHRVFFEGFALVDNWPSVDGGLRLRGAKKITATNWLFWRDFLRMFAFEQLLTGEARKALAEQKIPHYTRDSKGNNIYHGQRQKIPYFGELAVKHGIELDPSHFLHLSPKDPNYIRFTPDEKSRERDIVVETTISKYLRKYHPSLTDGMLRTVAEMHKFYLNEDGILFFSKPEDIEHVYLNGPSSCMSKGSETYKTPVHPAQMYGDSPGVQIAALPAGDGSFSARSLIYDNPDKPEDKRYIRVYGDDLLRKKLEKKGYKHGNWEGVKLRKISFKDKYGKPLPGTYVFPYIDDLTGGANGRAGNAQSAYTQKDWDYWLIVRDSEGKRLHLEATKAKVEGPEFIAATASNGAIGQHHGYDPMRHNSFEVRVTGIGGPYRPPRNYYDLNEWKERQCGNCGGVFDEEYFIPFLNSEPKNDEWKPDRFFCARCETNYVNGPDKSHRIVEKDGQRMAAHWGHFYAVNKETGKVYHVEDLNPKLRTEDKYDFVFSYKLKERGFVELYHGGLAKVDDACEVAAGQWFLKKDIIDTVFGTKDAKQRCFFLGQTAEGVMQYLPQRLPSGSLVSALIKGKFVIVGGKLEYRDKHSFAAKHRKKYFERIGELEEEEDDAPVDRFEQSFGYDEPLSMLDVMNTLYAYLMVGNARNGHARSMDDLMYHALQRLLPRIDSNLLATFAHEFPYTVKMDKYAGLEGIPGIYQQMAVAMAHGDFQDDDIEIDKKTGEAYLSQKGVLHYVRSYSLRLVGDGCSTRFVYPERSETVKAKRAAKTKKVKPSAYTISTDTAVHTTFREYIIR